MFLVFDIYDLEARAFWSFARVRAAVASTALKMVPLIAAARRLHSKDELLALLDTRSQLGAVGVGGVGGGGGSSGFVEGVYLRIDDERDEWLCERAKVVRADFTREIDEHWTKQGLVKNTVVYDGKGE